MNIGSLSIARIYRGLLDDSLAAASMTVAIDYRVLSVIRDGFSMGIPTTVPSYLADKSASPTLPGELRSDAARLLQRICSVLPLPHSPFVKAVVAAAQARE
jgi:hypothetical protein